MLEKQTNHGDQTEEQEHVNHSSEFIGDNKFSSQKLNNTTGQEFKLTKDCHHYTTLREVSWDIQK